MIQKIRTGKGMVARFGNGTIRINTYGLKTRYGGQIELTTGIKAQIGTESSRKQIPYSNKIVLDFANLESLNTLIQELEYLKQVMGGTNG